MKPEAAVDIINARFGRHPRRRALHAKGVFVSGSFTATPEAAALCRAVHLQGGEVPVLARVSNAGGDPGVPDFVPDVRGLAVSFRLDGAQATDLVAQSAPHFPVATPEEFVEFVRLGARDLRSAAGLVAFLARRPAALRGLPANASALRPPANYLACAYYAVHAFWWLDAAGGSRFVRLTWQPEAGDARLSMRAAKALGPDFLTEELGPRLARGPARFSLEAQIAGPGDSTVDPSARWPSSRRRVNVGTLSLTELVDDPEAGGDIVVFDPLHLADGIEASDDPVLRFRPSAYSASAERRG